MARTPTVIVDTHQHVWGHDHGDEPFPGFEASFSGEQAFDMMEEGGIDFTLLIPPVWMKYDNRYAMSAVAAHPDRFALVGAAHPNQVSTANRMAEWMAETRAVALRINLVLKLDVEWIDAGIFAGGPADKLWGLAEESDLPLVLRVTDQLALLHDIAAQHPRLAIVVEHCAAGARGASDPFTRLPILLELASHPNIHVKLSALPAYSKEPVPFHDLDEVVRKVVTTFGAGRCMFGSDQTKYHGKLPITDSLAQFQTGCEFLSPGDRIQILGRSAITFFRLPITAPRRVRALHQAEQFPKRSR